MEKKDFIIHRDKIHVICVKKMFNFNGYLKLHIKKIFLCDSTGGAN